MTTPAIFPAAMISLVALAAAYERRDRAAALWLGMALALSGWALLPGAAILSAITRRNGLTTALPILALAVGGTTLVLQAAALPHSLSGGAALLLGVAGAAGLIVPKRRRPPRLTHRLARLSA